MPAEEENKEATKETQAAGEKSQKKEPEKVLFTWKAPARPFKRRNREYYVTLFAMAAVVGLVLFLMEGFMPVLLIISLVFLFYVLNTVEPGNIEYSITNKGVKMADKRNDWEVLTRFWFTKRYDNVLLVFETTRLPGRLELVINPEDKEKISTTLKEYIVEEKAPPSSLDKAANWVSKKMPRNN